MKFRTLFWLFLAVVGIYVGGTLISNTVDVPGHLQAYIDSKTEVNTSEVTLTELRDEEVPLAATFEEETTTEEETSDEAE